LVMNLTTPSSVQKLQAALHDKAKESCVALGERDLPHDISNLLRYVRTGIKAFSSP